MALLVAVFAASTEVNAQDPINFATGQILESQWAGVGPFRHPFGCGGDPAALLQNHIAPSHIACVEASLDDELDYDELEAVTDGYVGPLGENDLPVWRVVNDGNESLFSNVVSRTLN